MVVSLVARMRVPRFRTHHSLSKPAGPPGAHRIPLKERTSIQKKSDTEYPPIHPENSSTQAQAEDLFWRWVSRKNFTVQELKELREDRLLSYVLDLRDLRIEFALF
ncbi:ATP-binding cassette (ABC) Superfamily [Phytophthora palmivora]|uniref:ATP-binding cassette (ABC) Superfamily n=1 Tax=Phytophthora palmivora TaxID=4796 RepID=A0A2P4XDB8_9STRA|nr:ATP-binding cassette (ABC) Superfamily [Phytophthora palmivora]